MKWILLSLLCVATNAIADVKLGYVDLQRALLEVNEGKEAKTRLKGELEKRKTELEKEQNKLRVEKLAMDKQKSVMSEEVWAQKLTEMERKLMDFAERGQKIQTELAEKERSELKKIFEKMDPIIADIAKRDGLSVVFEKTDSGLVWAPPSMDVTAELVRNYNEKHPVKGMKTVPAKAPEATPKETK
jgi:outer membrane protein